MIIIILTIKIIHINFYQYMYNIETFSLTQLGTCFTVTFYFLGKDVLANIFQWKLKATRYTETGFATHLHSGRLGEQSREYEGLHKA